jgi:hypothetical protein
VFSGAEIHRIDRMKRQDRQDFLRERRSEIEHVAKE